MLFNLGGKPDPAMNLPEFTYTGTYRLDDNGTNSDGSKKYELHFLTSGVLTPKSNMGIDLFLVGGGGGSSGGGVHYAGAGGGYTMTKKSLTLEQGTGYTVTVGAGGSIGGRGGTTKFVGGNLEYSIGGGYAPTSIAGGKGGSGGGGGGTENSGTKGGNGGSDGSDGYAGTGDGGAGQGTTTRAFGESTGTLYAGGGGGDANGTTVGTGGSGGGGDRLKAGTENTGGGAGGARQYGSYGRVGGSGIVIIRDAR